MLPMHIHARALKYFDAIRCCGSIREANRQLHVAASAVTRQLINLEEEVGSPLFERLPGGLRLTEAGEIFAQHVITVLQDERRLESELDMLRSVKRGEISILTIGGLTSDFIPNILEKVFQSYPGIRISVSTRGSTALADAIIQGDYDVGIGFSIRRTDGLRQVAVSNFEIGAVLRADHPLAEKKEMSFKDCARYPLIISNHELSIRAALPILIETGSIQLMKNLALRGVGVAFHTRVGMEAEVKEGTMRFIPLRTPKPVNTVLGAYIRDSRTLPPRHRHADPPGGGGNGAVRRRRDRLKATGRTQDRPISPRPLPRRPFPHPFLTPPP
ncbi:MAG: LysR family transcriptional regulator [Candidatus Protistobacter heckmanni]|nr:LysR family transcriptional regulator [Candidatus Protistobacter heckmanni]